MIDGSLRWELMQELNMVKRLIREAVKAGEMSRNLGNSALQGVGQIKSVIYSDLDFKESWAKRSGNGIALYG